MSSWPDSAFGGPLETFDVGGGGFGQMSRSQMQDLWKAMAAGQDIANPGTAAGQGFPYRVESLDKMMRYVSFRDDHVRFFTSLVKQQAFNTVEEWNLNEDYGENVGGFIAEGDLPEEHDHTVSRNYAVVKYLATLRRATHPLQLIRPSHGNVVRQIAEAGTLWLLRAAENACFNGDSRVISEEWDGIRAQLEMAVDNGTAESDVIRDMRGAYLTEEEVNEQVGVRRASPNFAVPTHLYYSLKAHTQFTNQFYPKERYNIAAPAGSIEGGFDMSAFRSVHAPRPIVLEPDVFIQEGAVAPLTSSGSTAKIPGSPTVATPVDTALVGAEVSQFGASDAGTYIWQIAAVNRYGKSKPTITAGVAITANQKAVIAITNPGGATGYEIYRTAVGGAAATARFCIRIPAAAGGGVTTFTDFNDDLPGTSTAYMVQKTEEALTFKQLAPMLKIPLARVDLSDRWAQVLYGMLILNIPRRHMIFKNVGTLAP